MAACGRPRLLSDPAAAGCWPSHSQPLTLIGRSRTGDRRNPEKDPATVSRAAGQAWCDQTRRDCRRAQRYLARRSAIRAWPDHLWERRREALFPIEERGWLRRHAERVSVVPIHLP